MIFEVPGAVVTSTNGTQAEAWMPLNRVAVHDEQMSGFRRRRSKDFRPEMLALL